MLHQGAGSGGAVRPETGKTCDDLLPILDKMDFLSNQDKVDIYNQNPLSFCPEFAKKKVGVAV